MTYAPPLISDEDEIRFSVGLKRVASGDCELRTRVQAKRAGRCNHSLH